MSSAFTDLTIVIPTYNREQTIRKSISYWDSLGVRVLVLDGSDLPIFQDGPLAPDSMISYFSFPRTSSEDEVKGSYYRRMRFAVTQVETKYVSICADDDFFLKSGIEKAVQLLDKEPRIDSVFRPCADYRLIDGDIYWNLEYSGWKDDGFGASADAYTRVTRTDRGYINYYSICRFEKWKLLAQLCFESEFGHSHVLQLLMDELGKILLRTAILSDLFYIRQYNSPLKYHLEGIGLGQWLTDDVNSKEVERIRVILRKALSLVNEVEDNDRIINSIFSFHTSDVRGFLNKVTVSSLKRFHWLPQHLRTKINRLLPRRISFAMGYRGKVLSPDGLRLVEFIKYLENNHIPFVPNELEKLSDFLVQ
jgi:glycosyltransferase domain-containing protein